jgi:hypothetical protein
MPITINGSGTISGVSATGLTTAQTVSASDITTGTLAAANGGTGITSVGTAGNVLTSNGTAWVSSAPSGSALVAINTTLVSSAVASITFSSLDTSTYISYMLSFEGFSPATGNNRLELHLGTSGGIVTSSDYYGTVLGTKSSSTSIPVLSNSSADNVIYLTDPDFDIRTDVVGNVSGVAWISNINNDSPPTVRGQFNYYNSNLSEFYNCFSTYSLILGSQTITQLRVRFAAGNIAKGRLTVYGLKAS